MADIPVIKVITVCLFIIQEESAGVGCADLLP
jgi:hypothetical protein